MQLGRFGERFGRWILICFGGICFGVCGDDDDG